MAVNEESGSRVAPAGLHAVVENAISALPFTELHSFRLVGLSETEYVAADAATVRLTAGGSPGAFAVRLERCESADEGAVALGNLHGAHHLTPVWTAALWEQWLRRVSR